MQLNVSKDPNGPVALFDLDHDLDEQKDVAPQHPQVVRQARRIFRQAHASSPLWSF